jgi:tetratricopeptide (TPR) repeat protein
MANSVVVRRLIDEADHLYACQGRLGRALRKIEQALRLEPGNAEALVVKGRILFDLDRPARQAMACFDQAISIDPTFSQAFLERSRMLYGLKKDNIAALRNARKALALAGRDRWVRLEALRLQGHVLAEINREREAIASYRAALRVSPKDARTHWSLGESLLIQGQARRALRSFNQALHILGRQRDPDQMILGFTIGSKAEALNALGRHHEALQVVEAGLRRVADKIARRTLRNLRPTISRLVAGRKVRDRG